MLYHIQGLCPRRDNDMGGAGFAVQLWPAWRDAVAHRALTQENIDTAIKTMGREWLDGCGFERKMEDGHYLYEPRTSLRVMWGVWGPEHITVPGNACGLDLSDTIGKPRGGAILLPHNVDHIRQAHLLLVVFTFFADTLVIDQQLIRNL